MFEICEHAGPFGYSKTLLDHGSDGKLGLLMRNRDHEPQFGYTSGPILLPATSDIHYTKNNLFDKQEKSELTSTVLNRTM